MQIVLDLPKETVQRAKRFAELTHRNLNEVITDTFTLSLPLFDTGSIHPLSVVQLSNDELLAATELQMGMDEDTRLSELLDHQHPLD